MMQGWWDYGVSSPWYGFILGPVMMIAFVAAAVLVVVWIARALGPDREPPAREQSPLDILKARFARGEIDKAEYEERRQLLSR
jgi:putative membrane protein